MGLYNTPSASLQRSKTPSPKEYTKYDTKSYLMSWNFEECGVLIHGHFSRVDFDSE